MAEITYQMILSTLQTICLLVGITYYLITLKNQNKARQAQLFMNIHRETQSKEAQTDFLDIETIEMNSAEDWIKLREDRESFTVIAKYLSYYEGIGVLVREGLIDVGLVAKLSSGNIIWFWEKYREGTIDIREHYNWPRWAIEVEYLYDKILDYAGKHPELEIGTQINR